MTVQFEFPNGRIALLDEMDLPLIGGRKLQLNPNRRGYVEISIGRRKCQLHRFLLQAGVGVFVDHINGDGLDNRRANLRLCNRFENAQNRRVNANSTTGFKGVTLDPRKKAKPYKAEIKAFGKRHSVGVFATAEEAFAAYAAKAKQLHGEFACVSSSLATACGGPFSDLVVDRHAKNFACAAT